MKESRRLSRFAPTSALYPSDIEQLTCLNPGYLSGDPDQVAMPHLRQDLLLKIGTENLINFTPRGKFER